MSSEHTSRPRFRWPSRLLIGLGVVGLAGIGLGVALWPRDGCSGIFEQTAPRLDAHLEIIRSQGSFAVGHDRIQELSESAQRVGLHLETCCTVLEHGQLGPAEFQQCIDTAAAYDRQVALAARQVEAAAEAEARQTGAGNAAGEEEIERLHQAIRAATAEADALGRRVARATPRPAVSEAEADAPALRVASQLPGIGVELVEFARFQNTLTLKLRFINSGTEAQRFRPSSNSAGSESSYLLDEATGKRYPGSRRSNDRVSVPAGESIDFWIKYVLPEGEAWPRHLTVVLNHGILLEHLAVPASRSPP